MSAAPDAPTGGPPTVRPEVDLGALVIPAVLVAIGTFLLVGNLTMDVAGEEGGLFGPKAFPWIVLVLCYGVAALMAIEVLRPKPVVVSSDPGDEADSILDHEDIDTDKSNWRSVGIVVGGVLLFAVTLEPLGWLIAGTALFAIVAFGLGARNALGSLLGGLGMTAAIQVLFSGFLGIHIPPGLLGVM